MISRSFFFVVIILAGSPFWHSGLKAATRLPSFNADIKQSSISGISSGAYMAVQFHVAFSSTLIGAGIVAGGPYFCAQGSYYFLQYRVIQCMNPFFWVGPPDPEILHEFAVQFAKEEKIDHLAHMKNDRIYIFSGTNDTLVSPKVVEQTKAFYTLAGVKDGNIRAVNHVNAGHGFLTDDYGGECDISEAPFINDCDLDQAGVILKNIYGELNSPINAKINGAMIGFSQSEFMDSSSTNSMSDTGYVYVPNTCATGSICKIHIVLHGCLQGAEEIGNLYYSKTGYNEWAAGNNIIVLYPQVEKSGFLYPNPDGCWDWWGYTGDDYYNRNGVQMAALMEMLKRLAGTRAVVESRTGGTE